MRKQKSPPAYLVRVITDSRDARRDKFITRHAAQALYEAGKLAIDLTNSRSTYVYTEVVK
jgi:hypothetical protein